MISIGDLPTLNAALNTTSALLVVAGFVLIRRQRRAAHAACMAGAVAVSLLFLVSYLTYHAHVGTVRFTGQGVVRPVYFSILISHTTLAAATALLLVPVTVTRAVRRRFDAHKRLARWTLPVWLYVSVTGVVVYLMLYHG